ncbi:unnamed protein product [Diamesa hyperborea]
MGYITLTFISTVVLYMMLFSFVFSATVDAKMDSQIESGMPSNSNEQKRKVAWVKNIPRRMKPSNTFAVYRRDLPTEVEFVDDNIVNDMDKRFDDYGHMRFGKRGGEGDQFDDYGHMRFGR